MKLEPVITYELSSYEPMFGTPVIHTDAKFDSVSSLRQSTPLDMGPNTKMTLKRFINVVDADYVPNEIETRFLPRNDLLNGKPVKIKEEVGRIEFFVADKLQYYDDIYKMLNDKYGIFLCIEKPTSLNIPCIVTHIETTHTKKPSYIFYKTDYRYLDQNDIVVDKKFNQIWPIKTNMPPIPLIELLNKKTEKIY